MPVPGVAVGAASPRGPRAHGSCGVDHSPVSAPNRGIPWHQGLGPRSPGNVAGSAWVSSLGRGCNPRPYLPTVGHLAHSLTGHTVMPHKCVGLRGGHHQSTGSAETGSLAGPQRALLSWAFVCRLVFLKSRELDFRKGLGPLCGFCPCLVRSLPRTWKMEDRLLTLCPLPDRGLCAHVPTWPLGPMQAQP